MSGRTFAEPKKKNSEAFSPIFGKKLGQAINPKSADRGHDILSPCFEHNFAKVRVESGRSFKQSCPLALSGPTYCPFGGACHTCPPKLQTKLTISKPGDKDEQESDRVASFITDKTSLAPNLSIRERSTHPIQRQETKKPLTEEEKYKEAAKKILEAFLETPVGKRITDKAKELGEDFVSTLPGKVVTGVAAAGVLTAIVAKNIELPIQPLPIPLDKAAPGLSMKITYEGPVRHPTAASIAFTYEFGGAKKRGKKPAKTKSERTREETAHLAHEQFKFRESLKTPEQKAEDEAFMQSYILHKTSDPTSPLYIPDLVPQKEALKLEGKKWEEETPLQRKEKNLRESTTGVPSIVPDVLRSPGQPLDSEARAYFEPRFGHDFSQVRVHTDAKAAESARAMNALAYTVGHDLVFEAGQYKPRTSEGHRLLSHELAHIVQQEDGVSNLEGKMGLSLSGGREESEAEQASKAIMQRQRLSPLSRTNLNISCQAKAGSASKGKTSSKTKNDPIVLIKINITGGKVTFVTLSGKGYEGTVDTDLEPGSYKLIPDIAAKKWIIPGTDPGLRFYVDLEEVDPWGLAYSKSLRLEVIQGEKKDIPWGEVAKMEETLLIEGDPMDHPNYIQNVIKGVGIFGWGGPFRLDRKIVNGMGVDSIYLPRNEVNLDNNPLKGVVGALNLVYKSRFAADAALSALGVSGMYSFYIGPGGYIYPTIISDTTAPVLCSALRKALEMEHTDAKAAEKLSIDLLLFYIGVRFPIRTGKLPKGTSIPKATVGGLAAAGGKSKLVFVEIGAGDLRASIELAKKGGVKVIAVDPVAPAASTIKELEAVGGTYIKGTAKNLSPGTADHVFQYLPWKITGTGGRLSIEGTGTWSLVEDTVKLLKPNGAAHFVTEEFKTAEFLAGEASKRGIKAVITETTAGAAAPGASGAGIPEFSSASKVWLVNIYK